MEPGKQTPFTFSICGIPELGDYQDRELTHVLSILDPEIAQPIALQSFRHRGLLELRFHDIIEECEGRIAPQRGHIERLLEFGKTLEEPGAPLRHLLIHCHAGISRSTAATIILLAENGQQLAADHVIGEVVRARRNAWPNLRMIELGDALLRREGTLVAAVRAHYKRALAENPSLGPTLLAAGRGREVLGDEASPAVR
jgi:predicted protein tyrosine phosphatase